MLPLVDEMIVAVGDCDDGTIQALTTIDSPKLKLLHTIWDPAVRSGGLIISQQTNLALDACMGDWCFYLQADEVIHENDLDRLDWAMRRYLHKTSIEGLSFRYHHFRADYSYRDPLPYRRQARIIRRSSSARSYGDGCGFRTPRGRLRTAASGAWIYHYGHVKPPRQMSAKMDYFSSLYDGRQVQTGAEVESDTYGWDVRSCERFRGTHPKEMLERIAAQDWQPPPCKLTPRWRNQYFYLGLVHKNSSTLRRWAKYFKDAA